MAEGLLCTRHSDVKPCDKWWSWYYEEPLWTWVALPWQVSCPVISVAVPTQALALETEIKVCMNQRSILKSQNTRLSISASSLQTPSSLESRGEVNPKPHWVWSCRSGMPSRLEWDFLARENIPHEQRPPSGPAGYEDGVEEHKIQNRQGSRLLCDQWWRGFESNQSNPLNLHPVALSPITAF